MTLRGWPAILILSVTLVAIHGCSEKVSEPPQDTNHTEVTFQRILDFQEETGILLHSLLGQMDTVLAKRVTLTAALRQESLVKRVHINSQGLAIEYTSGHIGGIMIDPEDFVDVHGKSARPNMSNVDNSLSISEVPRSRKSAFLCPVYSDRKDFADAVISAANDNLWKAGFDDFELYVDDNCGLDRFADMEGYGIIHIYSHSFAWPAKDTIEDVFLMTGSAASPDLAETYANELSSKKICPIYIPGKGNRMFLSPRFISTHNDFGGDVPIIYLGFGFGFLGRWPLEMRFNANVGAIISHDWRVFAEWNRDWACEFYEVMTDTAVLKDISIKDWYESVETRYFDSLETYPPLPRWTSIRFHGLSSMSFWKALRLTSMSPLIGAVGAEVRLQGVGFGSVQGESFVSFEGVHAPVETWSDTLIAVTVPDGGRSGDVTVTVDGAETDPIAFIVAEITGISPERGIYDDTIHIAGYGFGETQQDNAIMFDIYPAETVDWSDSEISVMIPHSSVTGPVYARLKNQNSNSVELRVYGIQSITPSRPTFGSYFELTGSELWHRYDPHDLTFNGVSITQILNWQKNGIRGYVPFGSSTGDVVVTINGESTRGYHLDVVGITDVQPRWGGEGCSLTVYGTGFGQSADIVWFGDVPATEFSSWSDEQIVVPFPEAARSCTIRVETGGTVTNGIDMRIMHIDSLIPDIGGAGDTITVRGDAFREYKLADSVMFGEDLGTIIYWSDTMVNVIVPPEVTTSDVRLHVRGQVSNGVLFTVAEPPIIGSVEESCEPTLRTTLGSVAISETILTCLNVQAEAVPLRSSMRYTQEHSSRVHFMNLSPNPPIPLQN